MYAIRSYYVAIYARVNGVPISAASSVAVPEQIKANSEAASAL